MDAPQVVQDVHAAYFAAGARVAISASYQASRQGFEAAGLDAADADLLLARSVELARAARDEAVAAGVSGDRPLLVAASVGPYGAVLAGGQEYLGNYGVPRAGLVRFHAERLAVLAAAGPDLFAVETIPDALEAQALVDALAEHPTMPAWVSFSCADDTHLCDGSPFAEAVATVAAAPTVLAVGVNCTQPEHVQGLLASAGTDLPFVVYPNAGRVWDGPARRWSEGGSDVLPEAAVRAWVASGATLVGGCCGLGPQAVRAVSAVLREA
jgi:homocysteine S-methyltransferase